MSSNQQISQGSRLIMGTMRLGKWDAKFDAQGYLSVIEACLDAGIDTFDLADIYGDYTAESDFGDALKLSSGLRDQVKIITKCGICRVCDNRPQFKLKHYDTSEEHITNSVENALRDLGTDRIDQLLIHRPDALLNADEVAETFTKLRSAGKVLSFGVSNFSPRQFELLHSRFPLATNQIEASIKHLDPFQDGTLDQLQQYRLRPQAWSPLGGGSIFKARSEKPQTIRIREIALELGQKYELKLDQVLLVWLLQHPSGIRPVLGTSKIERIRDAAAALNVSFTREDWYALWSVSTGKRVP